MPGGYIVAGYILDAVHVAFRGLHRHQARQFLAADLGPYELCFQKMKRLVRAVLDHALHRDLRDVRTVSLLCDCPEL